MLKHVAGKKNLLIAGVIAVVMVAMTFAGTTAYGEEEPLPAQGESMEKTEFDLSKGNYAENQVLVMFESTEKISGKAGRTKVKSSLQNDVSDITVEGLWSFKESGDMKTAKSGARKLDRSGIKTGYNGVALIKSKTRSTNELIRLLRNKTLFGSEIKYVEPNWKVQARDTFSDMQWSMKDNGATDGAGTVLSTPNISYQWGKGTTGSENIVAVVDTGVDYTHPDLENNIWENDHYPKLKGEFGYDFINGDADPMDDNGHGTHCAGIIGSGGKDIGTVGVNQSIRIMALKVLNEDGSAFMSHEIDAYNYIDIALDLGEPVRAINNSWGGGGYSEIFAELVDIVGEKGAISVCAAGNAGNDNDLKEDYPANIDSPYIVSVAATDRNGELAEYSNYGKETVDVAAPGSEILSTVPYDSYNPTIYDADKRDAISQGFNDYKAAGGWGEQTASTDPNVGTIYLNGELYDPAGSDQPKIELTDEGKLPIVSNGFESEESMRFQIEGMEEGDIACLTIPYDISPDADTKPAVSMMTKPASSKPTYDGWGASLIGVTDLMRSDDIKPDIETIAETSYAEAIINGETKLWRHLDTELLADDDLDEIVKKAKKEGRPELLQRQIVIFVYAYVAGDYDVQIDDLGLSKDTLGGTEAFERYDYMSGTSMAAPYITGAVALKAAELDKPGEKVDPETLINNTIALAKTSPELPVVMRGAFEFKDAPTNLPARIGSVRVSQDVNKPANSKIVIRGSGFNTAKTIEIGDDEDDLVDVTDKATITDKEISIADDNADDKWINNIKTIKVTSEDRSSTRRDLYLVNGKKKFTKMDETLDQAPKGPMTTDGRKLYWTDSMTGDISVMSLSNKGVEPLVYCSVDPSDIFKNVKTKQSADYGMLFGEDLAYTGGRLYTVVEYGMLQVPEEELIVIVFSGSDATDRGFSFTEKTVSGDGGSTIYSGEMRLIAAKPNKYGEAEAISLGDLPGDLKSTIDWTMAAYNGKLYFMGGYSYKKGEKGISKKVWIYDPAKKKWSRGTDLCEPRAGGKAIQSGGSLVYTMGYSTDQEKLAPEDQEYPAPLVFDGKTWTKPTDETISPHIIDSVVTRGKHQYIVSEGNIGLVKDGVAFMGDPVEDYGDTFVYDIKKKAYRDTGYNFITNLDSDEMKGIVVGGKMYGFEIDEQFSNGYSIPMSSGLINVTATKSKYGTIKGTGKFMPGETGKVTVKAKKNYRIKTLKVNGKKVKIGKTTTKKVLTLSNLSADKKVTATFVKYKVKVTVKKKGKGKITGGKTYVIGKKATIKVKAAKGYYIKSIKQGKKTIKVKKNAASKTFKFKVRKDVTVKVVFAKKKK